MEGWGAPETWLRFWMRKRITQQRETNRKKILWWWLWWGGEWGEGAWCLYSPESQNRSRVGDVRERERERGSKEERATTLGGVVGLGWVGLGQGWPDHSTHGAVLFTQRKNDALVFSYVIFVFLISTFEIHVHPVFRGRIIIFFMIWNSGKIIFFFFWKWQRISCTDV